MFRKHIYKLLGHFLLAYALVLLLPLAISLYDQPISEATVAFFGTILSCLVLGIPLFFLGRGVSEQIYWRESLIVAVLIWLVTPAIGALPFLFSHTLSNPIHAYFEAVSGFTTTGASVIASVEEVDQALLFWRSFIQWLGGIGVVVLFIAILPLLGLGGKVLLFSEMPGPIKSIWTPRIKETIFALVKIYVGLTAIQTLLIHFTHPQVGWIESLDITFSTLSTGGFSTRDDSIGAYHSVAMERIVIIFMLLGSINFSLYHQVIQGRIYRLWDVEFFIFILTVIAGSALLCWTIGAELFPHPVDTIRTGLFQFVSALTSTGFYTTRYDLWPYSTQLVMLIAMFLGGMTGSTAGGMKTIRQYIGFRVIQNHVESLFRPASVRALQVGGREIDSNIAVTILSYLVILVFFTVLGWLLLVLSGMEIWASLSTVACCINNVGLAFTGGGPQCSFHCFSDYQLIICSALMLLGRLEFYAFLALFVPAFWRD